MMAIEIKPVLWSSTRLFAAAALLLTAVACGAPGVAEGVVERTDFSVVDPSPVSRWAPDGRLVVMLTEEHGQTLRVVSLHLLDAASLPEGEPIALGDKDSGRPYLDVAWGELDVSARSDGARIVSTKDTRYVHAVGGTVELTWLDGELVGSFHAPLDDGGWLDGSFLVAAEAR